MKTLKKSMSSTIALLLIVSMTITMLALPNVNAQSTIKSYPLIDVIPNPCGINQRVLVNYGAINYLNAEDDGWNVTITVTKPDGTTDTLTPPKTWSTGNAGVTYVPDQLGTYYFQTNFPQQWYNYTSQGRLISTLYSAGQSEKIPVVVQQEAPASYPWQPLPSEYWTRTADSQLQDWYTIMGSWLIPTPTNLNNLYAPYNDGPETAHILWSQPIGDMIGGIAGGDTGKAGYETGDAYEGKWSGSIIIGGILYYNKFINNNPQQAVVAVDLHTGKTLWDKNLAPYNATNFRIGFGQTIFWWSRNNRAVFSYFVCTSTAIPAAGTTWYYFDAKTGNLQFNMTNVPSGTNYYGPNGEILKYSLVNYGNSSVPNWHLLQWNSSWVVTNGKTGMQESWGSQVLGGAAGVTYNATARGYDRNVSVPGMNVANVTMPSNSISRAFIGDKIIGQRVSLTQVNLWAISINPSNMGTLLYNASWTPPADWVEGNVSAGTGMQSGFDSWSQDSQVAVIWIKETRMSYGFNLNNGQYMWATEKSQSFQDAWDDSPTYTHIIVYGELISASCSGIVYAYNVTTGKLVWTYNATDPYHESYISNNWWAVPVVVTDGKIYIGTMEHSAQEPKPRGGPFYCLNATTGEEIWRIDGAFRQTRWGGRGIIGDSIIATMDTYDQNIYAIGKGPTTMTVTAPDTAVAFGTPVVIKGTVMDISPGVTQDQVKFRFANGVPAVSDDNMSEWMLHVYKQFQQPSNILGVPVSIDAVDSNNNYVHLGDTTTDASGTFKLVCTPASNGTYTIYASFAGSKAYYGSHAETAMAIQNAPAEEIVTPPVAQPSMADQYFIPAVVGIIAAIIIVGVLLAVLMLRKRQ
ncbi:MAG TPA: PQQ-binding-like beta-propeller repeat protein [Candidatus Sulfotelmatobacter sp.]|nr:PQQ-binding-like beta-propeller repeat protein [Candidatus Sulfotelmatobacter sp.]